MKRAHRRAHRVLWPLLLLCASAVVGMALIGRPVVVPNPVWPAMLETAST